MQTASQVLYSPFFEQGKRHVFVAPRKEALGLLIPGKPLWLWLKHDRPEADGCVQLQDVHTFFGLCLQNAEAQKTPVSGLVAPHWAVEACMQHSRTGRAAEWELAAFYLATQTKPPATEGRLVPFADVATAAAWLAHFYEEALSQKLAQAAEVARNLIAADRLFGWEAPGRGIVAMGMKSALLQGMGRLNLIYAPPPHRGRGYGQAITAALAQDLQSKGLLPVLYARTHNQAAMELYAGLGFAEAGRLKEVRFHGPPPSATREI